MEEQGLIIKEMPVPQITDNEVLVQMLFASVCGSDYPYITHLKDRSHLYGNIIGHEGAGIIVQKGKNVQSLEFDDYVGFESHRATDYWLERGKDPYKDPNAAVIGYKPFDNGVLPHGTFSEYIAVPAMYAIKLSKDLINTYPGSLFEPWGNAVRIFETARPFITRDSKIVVSGAGFQGVQIMLILKYYYGHSNIYAIDISPARLRFIKENITGNAFLPNELPNGQYDIWLEVSGSGKAIEQALNFTKEGGQVILFGIPTKEIALFGNDVHDIIFGSKEMQINGINVKGVFGRFREDWDLTNEMIPKIAKSFQMSKIFTYWGSLDNLPCLLKNQYFSNPKPDFFKAVFSKF